MNQINKWRVGDRVYCTVISWHGALKFWARVITRNPAERTMAVMDLRGHQWTIKDDLYA